MSGPKSLSASCMGASRDFAGEYVSEFDFAGREIFRVSPRRAKAPSRSRRRLRDGDSSADSRSSNVPPSWDPDPPRDRRRVEGFGF